MTPNKLNNVKPKSTDKIDWNHLPQAFNRIAYGSRILQGHKIHKILIKLDNLIKSAGRCLLRSGSWILQDISLVFPQDSLLHPVIGWSLSYLTTL